MRGGSLQRRLGVGLAVGVAAMWLLATLAAGFVVRHELDEAFDSALQETAQRLLPLAAMDIFGREAAAPGRTVAGLVAHEQFLSYLVRDASGTVLLRSHDADRRGFPDAPVRGFNETASHRLYGESAVGGSLYIEVAEPLAHRREAALEAMQALLLPPLFLVPASLLGVWWFVRRSLRPLRGFRDEIESRDGSDLSPVAAADLPDEIRPVALAVASLLGRLRRTLEAARSFTANSAHELRTPIAATLAQTQRLIAELPPGGLQQCARGIEASLGELARLSEKLMQLAKAKGGGLLAEASQDLLAVVDHVLDEFRHGPGGDRLELVAEEDARLVSRTDPDAFAILLRNLVENALKHGSTGGPVTVALPGPHEIAVINAAPVLPPGELARLRGRFERGPTDAWGSGLGLAIVEAIAAGAGGELSLYSPARGRTDGFEAAVRLPP